MEEWKECTIEDVLELLIDYRGKTPKKSETGIPTLSAKSVKMNHIDYSQCYYISKEEYDRFMIRGFPKKGDILLTTEAPLGMVAKLDRDDVALGQRLITLRGKEGVLDNGYLLYYFQSPTGQYNLKSRETGTTVTGIKQSEFRKLRITIPPLPTQQKIAAILSSLDDKIELNNKINVNLEQQAGALFKNWFVDFAPFGGKMPGGWEVGKLSDLVNVKYGKDHKKLDNGKYPVYGSGGIMRYADAFLYDKESVLIPRKGTLNNVFYTNEPFWSVDTMFYTEMKKENVAKYVYFFVKSKDLNAMNAGSAVPSMTTEILNAMGVVIPNEEWLEKFETVCSPMFRQIKQCVMENQALSTIRDTLLPKLMNGEIEV